jgi:hypothetical protein
MWDEAETRQEIAALEPMLAKLAGRPVRLVIDQAATRARETGVGSPESAALERLRAVYDCEEL